MLKANAVHTHRLSLLTAGIVLKPVKASAAELSLFTRCLWEELQENTDRKKA